MNMMKFVEDSVSNLLNLKEPEYQLRAKRNMSLPKNRSETKLAKH